MTVSPAGRDFIKGFERLSLTKYPDAGGYSIGWGHHIATGENISSPISYQQASLLFQQDVATVESTLNSTITVPVTQDQFDALADFVFNIGSGAWQRSTLLNELNSGNYAGAAQQFARWNQAQGKVNQSLVNRRAAEQQRFSSGAATS